MPNNASVSAGVINPLSTGPESLNDVESVTGTASGAPSVQLVFDRVSIDVPTKEEPWTKRILNEVTGIFGPAETVAVMGPSGSGKTTMLNALTGVMKPTSGSISCNGQPFDKAAMRRVSAFVPQDDLLTPCLTVDEAMMEAALFKMGSNVSEIARRQRVNKLLQTFGLEVCRDVLIGHPEGDKGISGGQKRRLSVALELCGEPSLLYLDEPTSGLDAVSTMSLVKSIAALSRAGMTIIATIHQPSAAAFFSFDRLLLLVKGSICYQGPLTLGKQPVNFFTAAGFPCPPLDNPADFMFQVVVENFDIVRRHYLEQGTPEDSGRVADPSLAPLLLRADNMYPSTLAVQLRTHIGRDIKCMVRDPLFVRLRVGSSISVGLIVGILYFKLGNDAEAINNMIALILFMILFLAIINALPVVVAVLPELAIVQKEVRNNWYSPLAYVPAKILTDTPLLIIPPAIFVGIVGNMTTISWGEDGMRLFRLYVACLLVVWGTHAWSLVICALAPSTKIATLMAPGSIMPMAVLSGFFVNQKDMTWVFRWATYIDYLNYAWQAMATAGFQGRKFDVPPDTGMSTGEDILDNRLNLPKVVDGTLDNYWVNIGILCAFTGFFRLAAVYLISRRLSN